MGDLVYPTRDELAQAEAQALRLLKERKGDNYIPQTPEEIEAGNPTNATPLAVYIFGLNGWVCPHCLAFTSMRNKMPLAPTDCHSCGKVLQQ